MHIELLVFLVIIIMIMLLVSLVYATRAAVELGPGTADPNISVAHWYLAWTVAVIWIAIAAAIVGVGCLFFFGPEFIPLLGKSILYVAVLLMSAALIAVGVVASISASYIAASAVTSKYKTAYDNAVISAVAGIGSVGVAIIIAVVIWHYEYAPATPPPDDSGVPAAGTDSTAM